MCFVSQPHCLRLHGQWSSPTLEWPAICTLLLMCGKEVKRSELFLLTRYTTVLCILQAKVIWIHLHIGWFPPASRSPTVTAEGNVGAVILYIFTACLCHTLIVTDDAEIHDMEKPLPKHQLRRLILLQKKLLYRACCLDDVHEGTSISQSVTSNSFGVALIAISANAMSDLYSRSSRRLLCSPKLWIEEGLLEKEMKRCQTHQDFTSLLLLPVCRLCPFLVSYKCRLKLFERIVTTNRTEIQGSNELRNLRPGIMCTVNRSRVLEDGLAHLNKLGRDLRQRIVVSYLSEVGARET